MKRFLLGLLVGGFISITVVMLLLPPVAGLFMMMVISLFDR